jgi:hypothetical protein
MKRLLAFVLLAAAMSAYAQQKPDLITVNTVKPNKGQRMAWEAAWKGHVAKFHAGTEKTNVYQIMSGPNTGYYHIVGPAGTFADLDKQRPDADAHNLDLDKTFFPMLENTMNGTFQSIDSLGIRPGAAAEAYVVTVRHLKDGLNIQDYRKELSRNVKIRSAQKTPFWDSFSSNYYEQLWDGSDQVTVTIRNLKDGFKSLAQNYYPAEPAGSPSFRDLYSKAYGNEAWDARVKLLDDAVAKTEQYIMRYRKDLSSK